MKDGSYELDKNEKDGAYSSTEGSGISSKDTQGSAKDYISGDSTPSSSGHQFPWIAMDPKKESKKSAKKTNS